MSAPRHVGGVRDPRVGGRKVAVAILAAAWAVSWVAAASAASSYFDLKNPAG